MPLIIPKQVGGEDNFTPPEKKVEPIESRVSRLIIPVEVGGDFVSQPQEPVELEKPKESERGFLDIITGSERISDTPELGTLPEFGTTERGDTLKIAAGLLSTFDTKAQMDMIKEAIPEAKFETTKDGSVIIEAPTESGKIERSVLNRPGFSPQDLTTSIAQVLAFIPAAKLAGLGKTLAQKVGIGAAGAGATGQGLQEIGVGLGREERDPTSTAIAAATGGLSEVVLPAIQAIRQGRQASKIGAERADLDLASENIAKAKEASEVTEIPLFKGQQTLIPSQLEKQSFVASLPAGSRSAVEGIRKQNESAANAVETFLNSIAKPSAVESGAAKVRSTSIDILDRAKMIRTEKASPFYNLAFEKGADVDTSPVLRLISNELEDLPASGEIAKTYKKVLGLITKEEGKPSLKHLHNAKIEIDQMISATGENSVGNTTKRKLKDVQEILLNQIDGASDEYRQAREAFREASPAVGAIEDSIIGQISKLDDVNLKQVTQKIFNASETNPQVLGKTRKEIQSVNPEAWNEIVRVELERRLGSIRSTGDTAILQNLPGQLSRALFPNEKSTKVLLNAVDSETRKNLNYLKTALERASLGRPGGSQTATREEIKKELRSGVVSAIRSFLEKPVSSVTQTGVSAVTGRGAESAFNKKVSDLAKAMYDTTWKSELKEIRKLNPESPAAARAMAQLLTAIEKSDKEQNQ